jgi:hypothetical protein
MTLIPKFVGPDGGGGGEFVNSVPNNAPFVVKMFVVSTVA